jgi:hypothetical protein
MSLEQYKDATREELLEILQIHVHMLRQEMKANKQLTVRSVKLEAFIWRYSKDFQLNGGDVLSLISDIKKQAEGL